MGISFKYDVRMFRQREFLENKPNLALYLSKLWDIESWSIRLGGYEKKFFLAGVKTYLEQVSNFERVLYNVKETDYEML